MSRESIQEQVDRCFRPDPADRSRVCVELDAQFGGTPELARVLKAIYDTQTLLSTLEFAARSPLPPDRAVEVAAAIVRASAGAAETT